MTNAECRSRVSKLTSFRAKEKRRIGHGDAGGPLVYTNALIGKISWNPQVVGSEKPEGFTRMSIYAEWI